MSAGPAGLNGAIVAGIRAADDGCSTTQFRNFPFTCDEKYPH